MALLGKKFQNVVGGGLVGLSALTSSAMAQTGTDSLPNTPITTLAAANTNEGSAGENEANETRVVRTSLIHTANNAATMRIEELHADRVVNDTENGYIEYNILPFDKNIRNPSGAPFLPSLHHPDAINIIVWTHPDSPGSERTNQILDRMLPKLAEMSERLIIRTNVDMNEYQGTYSRHTPKLFKDEDKKEIVAAGTYIPVASISMPHQGELNGRTIVQNGPVAMLSYDLTTDLSDREHLRVFLRTINTVIQSSNNDFDEIARITALQVNDDKVGTITLADRQPD